MQIIFGRAVRSASREARQTTSQCVRVFADASIWGNRTNAICLSCLKLQRANSPPWRTSVLSLIQQLQDMAMHSEVAEGLDLRSGPPARMFGHSPELRWLDSRIRRVVANERPRCPLEGNLETPRCAQGVHFSTAEVASRNRGPVVPANLTPHATNQRGGTSTPASTWKFASMAW